MAARTIQQLIEEQNRLAQAKAPQRPFKVVRVLVANRYSGPDLRAIKARVDDVIAVAGGRYADELIALGLVEIVVEEPQEPEPTGDSDTPPNDTPPSDVPPSDDPPPADDVTPPGDPEVEPAGDTEDQADDPTSALAALNIGELRTMAKIKGINSAGMSKVELIEALLAS